MEAEDGVRRFKLGTSEEEAGSLVSLQNVLPPSPQISRETRREEVLLC